MTRYQFVMGAVAALATAGLGWSTSASQADNAKAATCCCGEDCTCEDCDCCEGCKDGECSCGDDCTCCDSCGKDCCDKESAK